MAHKVETGIVRPQDDDGTLKEGSILEPNVSSLEGNQNQCSGNVTKGMEEMKAWFSKEKTNLCDRFQEIRENIKNIELRLDQMSSKMEENFRLENTHQSIRYQECWDTIKKIELQLEQMSSKDESLEAWIADEELMEDDKNIPDDVNRAAEQLKRSNFIYGKKNVAKWKGPILR